MATIIDGKAIAKEIHSEIKEMLSYYPQRKPTLAVLLVGEDPASKVYVAMKSRQCKRLGLRSLDKHFPQDIEERDLLDEITALNNDSEVDGILVQLPLPPHISSEKVMERISPCKDVDGFHPINVGKMLIGSQTGFLPCTPNAIKILLDRSGIDVEGQHVVIVGRSNIVGKPTAAILMQKAPLCNASVTVVHSRTKNLEEICRTADILVGAIGSPCFITKDMVKKGAVVIDVGINRVDDPATEKGYRLVGDVDYDALVDHCSHITPVPGGVGPMTIAMLLYNTAVSFQRALSCSTL